MRRLSVAAAMLLIVLLGCGRLNQQQDTLAPRVVAPEAPVPLAPAAAKPESPPETSAREDTPVSPLTGPISSPGAASSPAGVASPSPSVLPSGAASPALSASASSKPEASPAATESPRPSTASITVAPTATRALLQPMQHEFETWNNCAPVTAEMVLSYYGISKRQTEIAPVLRPHAKNFSVRMDQIAAYLAQFGLEGQPLIGGTLPKLKALISNNIPVVVEDQLSLQDDYGHFRVARGFDDAASVVIF